MQHYCRFPFLLLLGLLSLLGLGQARAQANFRPGYVLALTGDTLRGEVDLRDGRLNAQRCRFRPTAQADVVEYQPAQVRGYGFSADNKYYRTMAVVLEEKTAPQPYFLEVLVDGPASLYYLRDAEQREEFFVGLPNQPLALLKHGFVQVVRNNSSFTELQTGYRATLAAVLANCPVVEKKLPTLPFQESALIKVVSTYNRECAGYTSVRTQSTTAKSHFAVGVVAGAAQQHLSYSGYPYASGFVARDSHTGVVVGPTFRFTSGRLGQRISLLASVLYSPEKFDLDYDYGTPSTLPSAFRYHFDITYLRVPLMVRYTLGNGNLKPFGEAGFVAAFAIQSDNSAEQYNYIKGAYATTPGYFSGSKSVFRSIEPGFAGGLGVGTTVGGRLLSLQVRAEQASGFSDSPDIGTSVFRLYVLLSFDLTK